MTTNADVVHSKINIDDDMSNCSFYYYPRITKESGTWVCQGCMTCYQVQSDYETAISGHKKMCNKFPGKFVLMFGPEHVIRDGYLSKDHMRIIKLAKMKQRMCEEIKHYH